MLDCPVGGGNGPQKTKIINEIPKMRRVVKNGRDREVHWNRKEAISPNQNNL